MRCIIRFGICGCTSFFHGQFNGRVVVLPDIPEAFEIQEINIPEDGRMDAIRRTRVLFFLDVHRAWPREPIRWNTSLVLCELVPNGTHREKIYMACIPGKQFLYSIHEWNEREVIPFPDDILSAMQDLAAKTFSLKRRKVWIQRMTPEGWLQAT